METLFTDVQHVLREIGVNEKLFPNNRKEQYKLNIQDMMKGYYSQLPKTMVLKLYEIYEDDFVAFGYKIPSFLNINITLLYPKQL